MLDTGDDPNRRLMEMLRQIFDRQMLPVIFVGGRAGRRRGPRRESADGLRPASRAGSAAPGKAP